MEVVAGRRFARRPAELPGFRRRLVGGTVYPGLVPAPDETVEGVLWEGIDARALARIDRFEGPLYERPELRVTLGPAESCLAFVYLLRAEHRALALDVPWDEAEFREHHLRDYLNACRAFVRELRDERSTP